MGAIGFASAGTGVAVGPFGTNTRTVDSGESWQVLSSNITINHLFGAHFTTSEIGYTVGLNGTILKTTDAGLTWESISLPQYFIAYSFSFTNEDIGYVSGDNEKLIKTENGGLTWTFLNHSILGSIISVYFPSANIGFISGDNKVYKTIDGGINWELKCNESGCKNFFFIDSLTGYGISSTSLLSSTDGGESWSIYPVNQSNYQFGEISFPSIDTGYLVGFNGLILKTTCGGVITGMNPKFDTSYAKAQPLTIFPNPNQGQLNIRLPEQIKHGQIEVFSPQGKLVSSEEINNSNQYFKMLLPQNLPNGLYIVKLSYRGNILTSKIFIFDY